MARRTRSTAVLFPWERRSTFWLRRVRARLRPLGLVAVFTAFAVFVGRREDDAAGVRATRATVSDTYRALATYRADHGGACPATMVEMVHEKYLREVPVDAWGHPLRIRCPGRTTAAGDEVAFQVVSDGPDGIPGGLDRVE